MFNLLCMQQINLARSQIVRGGHGLNRVFVEALTGKILLLQNDHPIRAVDYPTRREFKIPRTPQSVALLETHCLTKAEKADYDNRRTYRIRRDRLRAAEVEEPARERRTNISKYRSTP